MKDILDVIKEEDGKKIKVADVKERMGYERKPRFLVCSNCANFTLEFDGFYEKKLRCKEGGFKALKNSTCKIHSEKVAKRDSLRPFGNQDDC
jgi:transcription initiation factor IIE alpha subunit